MLAMSSTQQACGNPSKCTLWSNAAQYGFVHMAGIYNKLQVCISRAGLPMTIIIIIHCRRRAFPSILPYPVVSYCNMFTISLRCALQTDWSFVCIYCDEPPEMVMTWPAVFVSKIVNDRKMDIDVPLTHEPSSEARKATTRATSCGSAQRPSGQCEAIRLSILSAGHSGVPPGM